MKSRIESENNVQKEYEDSLNDIVMTESNEAVGEEKVYHLLAGYVDEDGIAHDTFTLREMTGADEEYINRSDIKTNGTKISTALLSRCVTSIGTLTRKSVGSKKWEDIIKSLYVGDRDIMLMELRRISQGNEITVSHTCPNPDCKAKLKTTINLDELEVVEFDGMREIPFELPKGYTDKKGEVHKMGVMRRPNGLDGELLTPVAKNNLAKATTLLLTRICKFDDGVYIDESVMASLSVKDRNYLNNLLEEHFFGIDMSVDVMCDRCGEYFKGNLNQTNFI